MRSLTAVLLTSLCAPAHADVIVVGPGAGSDASELQAAVDLALPGDVLLVRFDLYDGFTVDGKGLRIVADGAPRPVVQGPIVVRNLPANEVFLLRGFVVDTRSVPGVDIAFGARDCDGHVWCEFDQFVSDHGVSTMDPTISAGRPGAVLHDVTSSSFARCEFQGGAGSTSFDDDYEWFIGPGGHGLEIHGGGRHSVHDCDAYGGPGGSDYDKDGEYGGNGGNGVHASGQVAVVGCELFGGNGGGGSCDPFWGCGTGGYGGHGIGMDANTEVWTLDNAYTPGEPGTYPTPGGPGFDVRLTLGSNHQDWIGAARSFKVGSPVRVLEPIPFTVRGEPGDRVTLLVSSAIDVAFDPRVRGALVPRLPARVLDLGVLPRSGVLEFSRALGSIDGAEALPLFLQCVLSDGEGIGYATGVSELVALDPSF